MQNISVDKLIWILNSKIFMKFLFIKIMIDLAWVENLMVIISVSKVVCDLSWGGQGSGPEGD